MSRTFSQRREARSFWSIAAGFVSIAAVTACSAGAGTTTDATTSQALSEATASASDTHAAAEACFTAFDACRSAATADADVKACKTTLEACLPAEAKPGPHCGPPPGKGGKGEKDGMGPGPKGGDCGGDGSGPPKGGPDGTDAPPPPPPPDGTPPPPDADGDGPKGPKGPPPDGAGLPAFCKDVPLPPPAAIAACKAPLDACLSAGTDKKTCFDALHACMKAAFDAALPPKSG